MIEKIDHVGLIVKNINKSIMLFEKMFGLKCKGIDTVQSIYDVKGIKVKIALLQAGEMGIELLEPLNGKYKEILKERGEGLHHLAFNVSNIEKIVKTLERYEAKFIHPEKILDIPEVQSKIAFLDPKFSNGVPIELIEMKRT